MEVCEFQRQLGLFLTVGVGLCQPSFMVIHKSHDGKSLIATRYPFPGTEAKLKKGGKSFFKHQ